MVKQGIIERTAGLGSKLQEKYPVIADLYQNGLTSGKIVWELDLFEEFGRTYSERTLRRAVLYHVSGYRGSENVEAYNGSVKEEERIRLARENRNGKSLLTSCCSEASRKGVIARKRTPWSRVDESQEEDSRLGELEDLLRLASRIEFQHTQERIKGKPDYRKLSLELHRLYPEMPARTPKAIRMALYKSKSVS